jgi:hypothetical protein
MPARSASLLSLSVALSLMAASLPALAKENDDVLKIVDAGRKTLGGKAYSVELVYGFEENKPSGAFTLTTNR